MAQTLFSMFSGVGGWSSTSPVYFFLHFSIYNHFEWQYCTYWICLCQEMQENLNLVIAGRREQGGQKTKERASECWETGSNESTAQVNLVRSPVVWSDCKWGGKNLGELIFNFLHPKTFRTKLCCSFFFIWKMENRIHFKTLFRLKSAWKHLALSKFNVQYMKYLKYTAYLKYRIFVFQAVFQKRKTEINDQFFYGGRKADGPLIHALSLVSLLVLLVMIFIQNYIGSYAFQRRTFARNLQVWFVAFR